jgi:hypothetical protein
MSKEQAEKIAKEYILKHKDNFGKGKRRVTKREIDAAVRSIAREIHSLGRPVRASG